MCSLLNIKFYTDLLTLCNLKWYYIITYFIFFTLFFIYISVSSWIFIGFLLYILMLLDVDANVLFAF